MEDGPDRKTDGVVRWRCADLGDRIAAKVDVQLDERLLKKLNFRSMSGRPLHPQSDLTAQAAFKTYGPPRLQVILSRTPLSVCFNVSGLGLFPRPRWRYARPGPHKILGIERHFLKRMARPVCK